MGKRIKIHFLLWLAGLYGNYLAAQQFVSPTQLLTSKTSENQTVVANSYFDDLLATRARWPWVDKFEIRTETDRLMTDRQEYLFRTSFLGFSRRKFEFLRHRKLAESKIADYREKTYKEFFERCLFVVSMIKNQAEADLAVARVKFHAQLDSLHRVQLAAGGDTDLRDFLKNREEWTEAEKIAGERRIYQTIMLKKEGYDTLAYLDTRNIIRPETIIQIVDKLFVDEKSHPELAEMESEYRYLESEMDAEKAKEQKILDFAQVRYATREDLLFENRFSVGVGINIPWSGASRLRHEDIRVKQEENKFEKSYRMAAIQRKLEDKKAEAKALFSTYELYSKQLNDEDWQNTRKIIVESGRVKPTDIYRLKFYEIDRMEKVSDIFHDLLGVCVEAMYYAGTLDNNSGIFER